MSSLPLPDLDALAASLRAAAAAYYDTDTELMSDADYDTGIHQLETAVAHDETLRARFTDLLDTVAGGQSAGGDVTHPVMMGSLSKAKTLEGVQALAASISGPVAVEAKLDGLAVRAVYVRGNLVQVVTRGDGATGEDITVQARTLQFLPATVGATVLGESFEVRGEVFMEDAQFAPANRLRETLGQPVFANQRNAAAGILRKGDSQFATLLTFAAYDVLTDAPELATHSERLTALETQTSIATVRSLTPWLTGTGAIDRLDTQWDAISRAIATLNERRPTLGFPIDGIVIKADRDEDRTRLGNASRAPRWAIAYKYEAETATTTVVDITTAVGRTGRLAIRVELTPVLLDGTTITYATGHNVSWMLERDIRIGDTVTIKRANDVIPYIEAVNHALRPTNSTPWQPPATDPNGNDWDKTTLLWRSTDNTLSVGASIRYATSRDALDIEGLGTEIVDALVETGHITRLPDLFTLTVEQLAHLELSQGRKLGQKNATKIINQINEAKNAPWARIITALGLRMTGRTMSRRLAAAFPTMTALRNATISDLASVDSIGDIKAHTIHTELTALASDANPTRGWTHSTLDTLEQLGINTGETPQALAGERVLEGLTVVVSGPVPGYTRTTVAELIESLGGRASGSVSASTGLLVSEPSTSSKYVKARQLGVRIVTPGEFLEVVQ